MTGEAEPGVSSIFFETDVRRLVFSQDRESTTALCFFLLLLSISIPEMGSSTLPLSSLTLQIKTPRTPPRVRTTNRLPCLSVWLSPNGTLYSSTKTKSERLIYSATRWCTKKRWISCVAPVPLHRTRN